MWHVRVSVRPYLCWIVCDACACGAVPALVPYVSMYVKQGGGETTLRALYAVCLTVCRVVTLVVW